MDNENDNQAQEAEVIDNPVNETESLADEIMTEMDFKGDEVKADEAEPEAVKPDEEKTAENEKTAQEEMEVNALDKDDTELKADMKERTAQRFDELKAAGVQFREEAQKYKNQIDQFEQVIAHSGASDQEFLQLVGFSADATSGDPARMQNAMNMLEGYRTKIAQQLGIEVPGVDLLTDHPDLAQKVENFEITRDNALEIANSRQFQAQQQTAQQQEQTIQQAQQQEQQEVQISINAIESMENNWKATDADYKHKEGPLSEYATQLRQLGVPASKWVDAMSGEYQRITKIMSDAAEKAKPKEKSTTLRPSPANNTSAKPGNVVEAVWQEFQNM